MSAQPIHSDEGPPAEIEALLPWYAAGTVSTDEARRVEAALDADPGLATHLARIHEERDASIRSAEALGLPSSRAAAKLFTALDAEPDRKASMNPVSAALGRAGQWLAGLSPRALGLVAGAAVLALVAQGGLITGELLRGSETYSTASGGDTASSPGAYVLVGFQPEARAAEIGTLLRSVGGHIVDGPYPGGLFKLRIGGADMSAGQRSATLDRLKAAGGIVRMAAPAQ